MSAQHTPGRLVEDTRGPRADIRSESGRIVAVTYGLGFPKTAEGLEKRTQEDRANRRRLVACWNACDGLSTEALESEGNAALGWSRTASKLIHATTQRDELLAALDKAREMPQWEHTAIGIRAEIEAAIAKVKGGSV